MLSAQVGSLTRLAYCRTADTFGLALRAEESRSLALDNPFHKGSFAARTQLSIPIIDPMKILVSARLVQGIAIRSVRKRRTFMLDGIKQNIFHRLVDSCPLWSTYAVTSLLGMHAGNMKNLGRVQIAYSRQGTLIEQGNFNLAATGTQTLTQSFWIQLQRIGSQPIGAQSLSELVGGQQVDGTESSPIPKPEMLNRALFQVDPQPQMLDIWWIGQQDQPRHTRFQYNLVTATQ